MKEIVLRLSNLAAEGTLSKVRSAIKEEAKLKLMVQSDLVFITGELKIMESFHSVADAERIKNNAIKTWLRQFRNLTYDAEDCIEVVVDFHWVFINRCILRLSKQLKPELYNFLSYLDSGEGHRQIRLRGGVRTQNHMMDITKLFFHLWVARVGNFIQH